jgi:hypothetical protein
LQGRVFCLEATTQNRYRVRQSSGAETVRNRQGLGELGYFAPSAAAARTSHHFPHLTGK